MKINYLILSHSQPHFLKRLIDAIDGQENSFFIHIDSDSDINDFTSLLKGRDNIYFLSDKDRLSIQWAGFNMVQATLNLMKYSALIQPEGFCVLLSGNDYPIKSNDYINSYFETNKDIINIEGFSLPSKTNWGNSGGMDRILLYHFIINKKGDKKSIESVYSKNFWKISKFWDVFDLVKDGKLKHLLKLFKRRSFPNYLKPYGGSQWWSMPMNVVKEILEFLEKHPDYIDYHKFTLSPDEIFFHSIVFSIYPERVSNKSTTWVNWIRPVERPPVVFKNKDDLDELLNCGGLYARKFDENHSSEILDLIDSYRVSNNK